MNQFTEVQPTEIGTLIDRVHTKHEELVNRYITKRDISLISGRLLEEAVELALACGLQTGEIQNHVIDSLHNQAIKESVDSTIFPSQLNDNLNKSDLNAVMEECADVHLVMLDLIYKLGHHTTTELKRQIREKQNKLMTKELSGDLVVNGNGLLYTRKPHINVQL